MLPSGMILWPQRRCVLYPQNEIFASVLPARASDPYRDSHAEMKQRNQWAQERRTEGDLPARGYPLAPQSKKRLAAAYGAPNALLVPPESGKIIPPACCRERP